MTNRRRALIQLSGCLGLSLYASRVLLIWTVGLAEWVFISFLKYPFGDQEFCRTCCASPTQIATIVDPVALLENTNTIPSATEIPSIIDPIALLENTNTIE